MNIDKDKKKMHIPERRQSRSEEVQENIKVKSNNISRYLAKSITKKLKQIKM